MVFNTWKVFLAFSYNASECVAGVKNFESETKKKIFLLDFYNA